MMTKTNQIRFCFLLAVILILTLTRCVPGEEVKNPEAYLTITNELPEPFGPNSGSGSIIFSTNEAWDVTLVESSIKNNQETAKEAQWYEVTPLSGEAGDNIELKINLQPNDTYVGRSFTIILRSETHEKRVEVSQLKKNAVIADENHRELTSFKQQLNVKVKSNVTYTIEIKQGQDWISEAPQARSGGLTTKLNRFIISANNLHKERIGIIVFKDSESELFDEVTVVQSAYLEQMALLALYNEAGGSGWTHQDNWCSDKPVNEWYGVETNARGNVIGLRLSRNNLTGNVPSEISDLTELKHLDLSWNSLGGDIAQAGPDNKPVSCLDGLTKLDSIDLSHNSITGKFLPALTNFRQLRHLNLSFNKFSGEWPYYWDLMYDYSYNYKRMIDVVLNNNYLYGGIYNINMQGNRDWYRIALQCMRQYPNNTGSKIQYDIILPDFTFTDLRDGSKKRIRDVYSSNTTTMILAWDPTQEDSKTFMESVLHRAYTLYSGSGFEIVSIIPEGDEYRKAAEAYLRTHKLPYPVVSEYADAQGRRIILPCEPYPSYFFVDESGKVSKDMFTGQRSYIPQEKSRVVDLIKDPLFQRVDLVEYSLPRFCKYESTDFSMDKKYELLHRATKGKGIDIILMGEAFTDIDIESGIYKMVMERAMEAFFSKEPTKSYREYFNIYMVYAVSRNGILSKQGGDPQTETALDGKIWDNGVGHISYEKVLPYRRVIPSDYSPVVGVIVKDTYHKSFYNEAYVNTEKNIDQDDYGYSCDYSVTTTGMYSFSDFNAENFVRETVGCGFGLLAAEYWRDESSASPGIIEKIIKIQQKWEQYLNISHLNDPKSVYWSHLIGHPKYPEVGLYEGGYGYSKGIWRSEKNSIMGYNIDIAPFGSNFNAIGRQLIVKRIMELAGEEFTVEKFIRNDVIEAKTTPTKPMKQQLN